MSKKLVLILAGLTLLLGATITGCSNANTKIPKKEAPIEIVKPKVSDSGKKIVEPSSKIKYKIAIEDTTNNMNGNTPWELSPKGELKASIEGRGDKAEDEGYSRILIEDKKSGEVTSLTLENEDKLTLAAKDLEWIDESNLFVILGQPFGTISKGGKIYKVNIKTGEVNLFKDIENPREEYISVKKSAEGFSFEKYVYEDDNFIKGHFESGKLE